MKIIKPLRQTPDGYIYGIEGTTEYIHIPFSKIEWFLYQLTRIRTHTESEALCSFSFDYPDGLDMFYAANYPPENSLDFLSFESMKRLRERRRQRNKLMGKTDDNLNT